MVMEDHAPEQPDAQRDTQPERRPWKRHTVTLAAAGALTAGAAAFAVPALASETTSPTPTPGYSTEEGAPEGQSDTEREDCPEGQPGSGEGRGPRPPRERGDEPGATETPAAPGTEGNSATSDA
jgi:hypothetical protein